MRVAALALLPAHFIRMRFGSGYALSPQTATASARSGSHFPSPVDDPSVNL